MSAKISGAGLGLLQKFIEAERTGDLVDTYDFRNEPAGRALRLRYGDGAQKNAAEALARRGFGKCCWSAANKARFFWISEEGRQAASVGARK